MLRHFEHCHYHRYHDSISFWSCTDSVTMSRNFLFIFFFSIWNKSTFRKKVTAALVQKFLFFSTCITSQVTVRNWGSVFSSVPWRLKAGWHSREWRVASKTETQDLCPLRLETPVLDKLCAVFCSEFCPGLRDVLSCLAACRAGIGAFAVCRSWNFPKFTQQNAHNSCPFQFFTANHFDEPDKTRHWVSMSRSSVPSQFCHQLQSHFSSKSVH